MAERNVTYPLAGGSQICGEFGRDVRSGFPGDTLEDDARIWDISRGINQQLEAEELAPDQADQLHALLAPLFNTAIQEDRLTVGNLREDLQNGVYADWKQNASDEELACVDGLLETNLVDRNN